MARAHGIAVVGLILLGTGVWFALAGEGDPAPAPAARPTPTPAAAPPVPDEQVSGRVEQRLRETPRAPAPSPAAPPVAEPPAAPTAAANVELHVRDLVTKAPLPAFQWRWRSGAGTARGDGKDGAAALSIPPANDIELLVECAGYEPVTNTDLAIAAAAPPLQLELFLLPIARATGVRLHARDELGNVVANLQVACFRLAADEVWQPGDAAVLPAVTATPLWRRRTAAADGVYALPELAPARYSIEAVAIDGDGALLPRLPAFCTFEVTGSNAIEEQLTLPPGTVLTLELCDLQGNLLDPAARQGVAVRLRRDGDAERAIDWVTTTGARLVSADAMPAAAPIMARLPLAPGSYSLEIRCHGELRLSTSLVLRAGAVQTERITVP